MFLSRGEKVMKISKTWLGELRKAMSERSESKIVIWLKRTLKDYENLDRDDIAIIDDVVGTLKSYGWEQSEDNNKIIVKADKFINLSRISFK